MLRLVLKVTAAILILVLGALMLGPFEAIERAAVVPDYIAHAIAFFLITVCLHVLTDGRRPLSSILLAVALGGLVEQIQGRVGRDPSWSDFIADIVGAVAAVMVLVLFHLALRARRGGG